MWFLAVGPSWSAVPVAFRDGDVLAADGAVRFGLVGGFAWAGPVTEADLADSRLSFVVLAGDAVTRGSKRAWSGLSERLQERLHGIPVVPLPGAGEGRGDRSLATFAAAWDGLGVVGLSLPVPWRSFDVRTGETTWRFLVLDAETGRPGTRFEDELSWVPKVVADGDEPLILLSNLPVRSLSASWNPADAAGAEQLHALVRRHSGPTRIALVASGGAPSPEFVLPGGPWGEGWLGVGRTDGPADTLQRVREPLTLEPGLDSALSQWFVAGGLPALSTNDDYRAETWPVQGWWRVTLDGAELSATLRMCRSTCADVYTVRWTEAGGWRYPTE